MEIRIIKRTRRRFCWRIYSDGGELVRVGDSMSQDGAERDANAYAEVLRRKFALDEIREGYQRSSERGKRAAGLLDGGASHSAKADKFGPKLTESDVLEARRIHDAGGISYRAVARILDKPESAVRLAIQRKTWKHIE